MADIVTFLPYQDFFSHLYSLCVIFKLFLFDLPLNNKPRLMGLQLPNIPLEEGSGVSLEYQNTIRSIAGNFYVTMLLKYCMCSSYKVFKCQSNETFTTFVKLLNTTSSTLWRRKQKHNQPPRLSADHPLLVCFPAEPIQN